MSQTSRSNFTIAVVGLREEFSYFIGSVHPDDRALFFCAATPASLKSRIVTEVIRLRSWTEVPPEIYEMAMLLKGKR